MSEVIDGKVVHCQPMLAYPNGCLVAADLLALLAPAFGALPDGMTNAIKNALSGEGSAASALEQAAILFGANPATGGAGGKVASALFDAIATMLLQLADRARFERLAGPLLACLTVEHGDKLVPLDSTAAIQTVTGTNIALLANLLAAAVKGNMPDFFSGGGATIAAPPAAAATPTP